MKGIVTEEFVLQGRAVLSVRLEQPAVLVEGARLVAYSGGRRLAGLTLSGFSTAADPDGRIYDLACELDDPSAAPDSLVGSMLVPERPASRASDAERSTDRIEIGRV